MVKTYNDVLFRMQSYQDLIKAINDEQDSTEQQELHEMVENAMKSALQYVNAVDSMELAMPRIMATLDGEDMRRQIEMLDKSRRCAHEAAIAQVSFLNRICDMYGIAAIYTGSLDDRIQIGDFCIDVVKEVFAGRKK